MTFAHPYFLLLLLLVPVLAWWKGRRGRQAAFLYSSVQLVKGVAEMHRSRAGQILAALRWLALAFFVVGMARPQLTESEEKIKARKTDARGGCMKGPCRCWDRDQQDSRAARRSKRGKAKRIMALWVAKSGRLRFLD